MLDTLAFASAISKAVGVLTLPTGGSTSESLAIKMMHNDMKELPYSVTKPYHRVESVLISTEAECE